MGKVVIKILQGSAVTQTVLGGQLYIFWLQISHSVYVPKIMEIGWQQTKLLQKLSGLLFFGPPCIYTHPQPHTYSRYINAWVPAGMSNQGVFAPLRKAKWTVAYLECECAKEGSGSGDKVPPEAKACVLMNAYVLEEQNQ